MPEPERIDFEELGRIKVEEAIRDMRSGLKARKLPEAVTNECPFYGKRLDRRTLSHGAAHQCPHCLRYFVFRRI